MEDLIQQLITNYDLSDFIHEVVIVFLVLIALTSNVTVKIRKY